MGLALRYGGRERRLDTWMDDGVVKMSIVTERERVVKNGYEVLKILICMCCCV